MVSLDDFNPFGDSATGSEKTILAIDIGTKMGWALSRLGRIDSGVWNFSPKRHHGGGMRFRMFEKTLLDVLESAGNSIDEIYYEEVRGHRGVDAAHIYGGFLAILTSICEDREIPYLGVPVGTIKKHATGKGNCGKEAMIAAAVQNGWDPSDDNEADALWLLDAVLKGAVI